MLSISGKIGCAAQTLHERVKKAAVDPAGRAGVSPEVAAKLKPLARANRDLRQANDISRQAAAYFAMAARA